MSTVSELPRLLALVPYLVARPGVSYDEAAAHFGVSEEQLRKDLSLLYMCCSSKYYSDSFVDVDFEGDTITMRDPQGVDRPLRLSADEAMSLVVALRTLAATPGLADADPVLRALAKIETAAGDAGTGADQVSVAIQGETATLTAVRTALDAGRALRMTYWTAGRDATTDRVVDPVRLRTVNGRSYLDAWCRKAEDVRTFHLGRVQEIEVLEEPSSPPEDLPERGDSSSLFQPSPEDLLVRLELGPGAAWVVDYYPTETVEPVGEDRVVVTLRARDESWVRRLVLSLGSAARILEPAALTQRVRDEAHAALSAYERA